LCSAALIVASLLRKSDLFWSTEKLEKALAEARERLKRAGAALAPKHKGGEIEEWRAACEALLVAERSLASARKEPFAVPVDFPVRWDVGAPLPILLKNDYRAFIVFYLKTVDPNWDGTYVNIIHTDSAEAADLAVVEFQRCKSVKMGTPNDEVSHGHPLYGKGFRPYTPLRVENSEWIIELEKINSVHRGYKPDLWRNLTHYILGFHDSTFECVAESFRIEVMKATMAHALEIICERLLV
jgi:hypothetical protein